MIVNGRVMGLARAVFPLLERAGIAGIAFKGPFQHLSFHQDPFFFRANDLDLLVARDQFPAALALLEAHGFVRKEDTSPWWMHSLGEVHLRHPRGGVVDLHHRLQQPGCPPPRDLAEFLRDPAEERLGGVRVPVPAPPQALLICALNLAKEFVHRRAAARYAFDFAAGLRGMTEPERHAFAAFAERQALAGTASFCAVLCERAFGLDLPLPLARRALPDWAGQGELAAMLFEPDGTATAWPRRRAILWEMCSGEDRAQRATEFAREAARMIASEALRRASGKGTDLT